jgi:hypothetical protein
MRSRLELVTDRDGQSATEPFNSTLVCMILWMYMSRNSRPICLDENQLAVLLLDVDTALLIERFAAGVQECGGDNAIRSASRLIRRAGSQGEAFDQISFGSTSPLPPSYLLYPH